MNRIDGLNPLATSRTQGGAATGGVESNGRDRSGGVDGLEGPHDRVSLSSRGRIVAEAAAAVANAPDVRSDRVLALKAAIANGTYQADARGIAERLVASGSFGVS
jgi:negative regulator of flagellin synthesis FlgM